MSNWNLSRSFSAIVYAIISAIILLSGCRNEISRDITPDELREHVVWLSSDSLKGRLTGTEGDSLAAEYIREKLFSAGLIPLGGDGFQRFSVTGRVLPGPDNSLSVGEEEFITGKDFVPLPFSSNMRHESEVIFAGYGFVIDNDTLKWNDYDGIDVTGKWVMVLRGDPEPEKSVSGFIPFNSDRDKAMIAKDLGAAGILFVSGPVNDEGDSFDQPGSDGYSAGIPAIRIKREVADRILNKTRSKTGDLEKSINSSRKSKAFNTLTTVTGESEVIKEVSSTRNVVMLLQGEDENLRNEYLIIGAHFDHLGMGGASSRVRDTVAVHNGADDNASGVSGIIELAERFSLTKGSHRRSIIVTAFSGEESGLLGSKHFAENPPIDLKKVNAMINLDMVGRLSDSSSLQTGGIGTAEGLRDLVLSLADTSLIDMTFSEEGYGPSDHSSFYGKNIPVLFFSTGAHLDYHTPFDTWEKLNYHGMKQVSDIIFRVAEHLANSDERLTYIESGPPVEINRAMRRRGVTLGIMPDFAGNIKNGLRADFVTPGKPAAIGGMKKGDIITAINGKTINNIQDYMFRMGQLKHGETISVEVIRNGKKEVLLIQL